MELAASLPASRFVTVSEGETLKVYSSLGLTKNNPLCIMVMLAVHAKWLNLM